MGMIWSVLENKNWNDKCKKYLFLLINCLLFCVLGFVAWLIVRQISFETVDWMICFMGYPTFFLGFVGGVVYLCRK